MAQNRRGRNYRYRNKKHRQQELIRNMILVLAAVFLVAGTVFVVKKIVKSKEDKETAETTQADLTGESSEDIDWTGAPPIDVQLLTVNEYSRPGIALEKVNGIVVHYTANPGATAKNNRDYFEGLKDSHTTKASSHFIIGLDGEVVQCIPTSEISYASNDRNSDTISIECCHSDDTGKFEQATYDTLVKLTAWLSNRFNLTTDQIIRHYDVTGKLCPKYFVEHEDAWVQFKQDVDDSIVTLQEEIQK